MLIVFGRFGWPLKEPGWCDLSANPLIFTDSAGWTGWEVLTVYDGWKVALLTVLVEVERVNMAVVCPSTEAVTHLEQVQRDWIIQKCCGDCPEVQLKLG